MSREGPFFIRICRTIPSTDGAEPVSHSHPRPRLELEAAATTLPIEEDMLAVLLDDRDRPLESNPVGLNGSAPVAGLFPLLASASNTGPCMAVESASAKRLQLDRYPCLLLTK